MALAGPVRSGGGGPGWLPGPRRSVAAGGVGPGAPLRPGWGGSGLAPGPPPVGGLGRWRGPRRPVPARLGGSGLAPGPLDLVPRRSDEMHALVDTRAGWPGLAIPLPHRLEAVGWRWRPVPSEGAHAASRDDRDLVPRWSYLMHALSNFAHDEFNYWSARGVFQWVQWSWAGIGWPALGRTAVRLTPGGLPKTRGPTKRGAGDSVAGCRGAEERPRPLAWPVRGVLLALPKGHVIVRAIILRTSSSE